jgi:protein-S-isoprenylcysteine O-methyltransferase Ste14
MFWKNRLENKGRLYTGGLFSFSMHISYFGDILWVTGYALVSGSWWSVAIVIFLLSFFVLFNIPKLDTYLAEKYGEDFAAYARKTKKLIPFVY